MKLSTKYENIFYWFLISFLPVWYVCFLKSLYTEKFLLSSRSHLILGSGCPCALQTSLASVPSFTITSELVRTSSMSGGTKEILSYKYINRKGFEPIVYYLLNQIYKNDSYSIHRCIQFASSFLQYWFGTYSNLDLFLESVESSTSKPWRENYIKIYAIQFRGFFL